jgi:EmrB/QacA subfamily drug resistance transporter
MASSPNGGAALRHRQILVVFSGLMLGMLLAALDQTIVATALPTIVGELGGLDHLSWVVTAYLLTSTASTPIYGKVSDLYGRKVVFQTAIVIFLVGSVLSGVAQNMLQLVLFRAIQGLGAGGLISMAMAIVGDVVSPRERGRYVGYMGAVFALASVAGPLLGGFFVDNLSWRWVFYVNVPVGIVALVVTSAVLRIPFRRVQHAIDYLGAMLLIGAVTCLLLVTVWGGNEYDWTSPTILMLGVSGAVLTALFLWQERRAPEPILPLRLFRIGVFRTANAMMFIVGLTMFGAIVFIPLFLQVVRGVSPTQSGLLLLPLMGGIIFGSVTSGRVISRIGRYKAFPIGGTALSAIGLWLLTRLDATTSPFASGAYMVVLGLGIGFTMQVLVLAVQNAVNHSDLGTATSSATFFRSMGGAFGTAIFGSIFASRFAGELARLIPGGLEGGVQAVQATPERIASLPAPAREAIVTAMSHAVDLVFLWAVPFAIVAFLLSLLLEELPLREHAHVGTEGVEAGLAFEPGVDPDHAPALIEQPERSRRS